MADVILYTNNAETLLATTINAAATSVVGSDCSAFPSPGTAQIFYATLTDGVQTPEIIKVTARSTNTLTVVRAQEGTTAKSWTATSTTISVRITAASLNQFAQGALNSGNAKGTEAIDFQTARSGGVTKVASGNNSIALGSNNVASGTYSVALGTGGTATGQGATAIGAYAPNATGTDSTAVGTSSSATGTSATATGSGATATANYAASYGYSADATAADATAVGSGTTASGVSGTAVGKNAAATVGANATAIGSGAAASTDRSTAVGYNAVASTQADATAIGSGAAATTYFTTAVGFGALASGTRALALGNATASADDTVALAEGATASASGAIAIGNAATASGSSSLAVGGGALCRRDLSASIARTRILSLDTWATGSEYGYNTATDETVFSSYMDLTGGSTWTTATSYNHGHVVKPTTPNSYQYWLWTSDNTSITTAGAEPTWPTTHGDSVAAGSGAYWICVDAANYVVTLPTGVKFFPKSVGFIVEKYDTVTVQPDVSFGESGSLTKYLASTTTTKLTAAYAIEEYTALASYVGGGSLAVKLQTAATGTHLLGRAFWTGKFVDVVT
jgi:hypothetical protein